MRDETTLNMHVTARVGDLRTDLEQLGRAALPTSAISRLPLCCYGNSGMVPTPRPRAGTQRMLCKRDSAEPGLSGEAGGGSLVPCTTSCPNSSLPSSPCPLPGCSYASWDSILTPVLPPVCSTPSSHTAGRSFPEGGSTSHLPV